MENDILDAKFDLVPLDDHTTDVIAKKTTTTEIIEGTFTDPDTGTVVADFEKSRSQLNDIIKIGAKAVDDLGVLASQSQDPEHYTALSSLIKNVSDVTTNLLKLHKQVEEIKSRSVSVSEKNEYHKHLHFSGSTAELLKRIEEEQK